VRATIQGLASLTTVDQIARERGMEPASIPYRSRSRGKETAHA
jgi:ribosomal protein S5